MGRKPSEPELGLPPLTFSEAARVLGLREGDVMAWVMETVRPSPQRWSEYTRGRRPLPEKLIRLYLMTVERLVPVKAETRAERLTKKRGQVKVGAGSARDALLEEAAATRAVTEITQAVSQLMDSKQYGQIIALSDILWPLIGESEVEAAHVDPRRVDEAGPHDKTTR